MTSVNKALCRGRACESKIEQYKESERRGAEPCQATEGLPNPPSTLLKLIIQVLFQLIDILTYRFRTQFF